MTLLSPVVRRLRMLAACLIAAVALGVIAAAQAPIFDVLITGGRIVDGTGAPWFEGDIGIVNDRIQAVGKLGGAAARTTIDAHGLMVSPGFIDTQGQSEFTVDRKSTRLNSSHIQKSRMPSSA